MLIKNYEILIRVTIIEGTLGIVGVPVPLVIVRIRESAVSPTIYNCS